MRRMRVDRAPGLRPMRDASAAVWDCEATGSQGDASLAAADALAGKPRVDEIDPRASIRVKQIGSE
jgi:hypothetical protein